MADAFDPYNEWLDIPPEDQPPHHYQLLGIDLFEGDGEKIAHAALSRTETLRTYQLGSHFEASQQLLNQVAQAKLCLLDAERKAAYDAALKQRLSPAEAPAPTATDPAKIQRPQPTAEEAAEPIRNLDSQPEAEQKPNSGEDAEQEEPTVPSTLPDFDAEPRTVRRTTGRKRRGTKPAASRVRDSAKRKERIRAGRDQAGREAEKQHSKENSISPAVKIRLAVGAGVLFVLIIAFFVMTYQTPDSEVRSLLARAEVKIQLGDLDEATHLVRKATNIEGANNLSAAKKLLDAIAGQQEATAKAEAEVRAKQISERKAKEEAERKAKIEAERKADADRKVKEEAKRKAKAATRRAKAAAERKEKQIAEQILRRLYPSMAKESRKAERTSEVRYYENGQKSVERNYKNGKKDGLTTQWRENGQKWWESHYKNDKLDGLGTYWHENGQKAIENHYKNGKKDGLQTEWDENGNKTKEIQYEDGETHGLLTNWYENGKKKVEAHYKNGKLDGLVTYWDENGNKAVEEQYQNGVEISRKEF